MFLPYVAVAFRAGRERRQSPPLNPSELIISGVPVNLLPGGILVDGALPAAARGRMLLIQV